MAQNAKTRLNFRNQPVATVHKGYVNVTKAQFFNQSKYLKIAITKTVMN